MSMKKMHFSILINAPKENVWHAMLDAESFRAWTKAFNVTSYFEGDWSEGSKMLFLGSDPMTGETGGMVARVAENRPYEYVSLEHVGIIKNGVEDTTSEEIKKWVPAFENYTFKEKDGQTEVLVDMDAEEENLPMFETMWPQALQILKKIAESGLVPITIEVTVQAPMDHVWETWTSPEHIVQWAFASDDWEAPAAENDVRVGGRFKTAMSAKDKSTGFDFTGTYTVVEPRKRIEYDMDGDDHRHVSILFTEFPEGVRVAETFDPETENPADMQRSGWQSILDNFKRYAEGANT
jgi:uncharacterized protein YndB with AHSA1/START domain